MYVPKPALLTRTSERLHVGLAADVATDRVDRRPAAPYRVAGCCKTLLIVGDERHAVREWSDLCAEFCADATRAAGDDDPLSSKIHATPGQAGGHPNERLKDCGPMAAQLDEAMSGSPSAKIDDERRTALRDSGDLRG